jgi:ketosteroid isomerase-like protein
MSENVIRNKVLVLKFFERVSDESDPHNVESAMSLFADDSVFCVMGSHGIGGAMTKNETIRKNIEVLETIKGRMKFKIHSMTAEDNRVAVEAQNTCKLIDGEVYDNFYHFLFIIENGQIQRVNEYLDTLYLSKIYQRMREHPVIAPRAASLSEADTSARAAVDPYFEQPLKCF